MKKKIIFSFILLFLLLLAGVMATFQVIEKTTASLTALLLLHKVEAIRQDLVINVQTVQTNLYTTGTAFGRELDIIVDNVLDLADRAQACMDCHHEAQVEKEIVHLLELMAQYKEALSYFITSTADHERVRRLQVFAADIGDRIIEKSQWMTTIANNSLHLKTTEAMTKVASSKRILTATLAFALCVIVVISLYFIRSITGPVSQLLRATRKIKEGEFQYRIEEKLKDEFGELAGSFNEMSDSLGEKEKHIQENIRLLNELHRVALPLHAAHELTAIVRDLGSWLATLIDAESRGVLLPSREGSGFRLHLYDSSGAAAGETEIPVAVIENFFRKTGGEPLQIRSESQTDWPFGGNRDNPPDHGVAVWLVADQRLEGALVATKEGDGGFREEEVKAMELLANNLAVAMVNLRLYRDLELRMEELQKTQQQLVQAEKLTAVGTLAGGIAHDFNNILCGMLGHLAILKLTAGRDNKEVREGLEVIEQAGFRAANLIKQMMTFSRQKLWEKRLVNLNEKILSVISLFDKTVSKLLVIKLDLTDDLPSIPGDPGQIEQVVMNLCVNARDAMPAGGTLSIRTACYHTDGEDRLAAGDYVLMSISDTGIGMDAATVSRIFEPFFTTKETGKGTGLGLAIVHGIVERHGGSCRVESSPGQGAIFTVFFPVSGSVVEEAPPQTRSVPASGAHGVLIVDDEADIAAMVQKYLRGNNWSVYTAGNGQEAIDILIAHQKEIDLVILDLNMPVMGGEEAFQRLKAVNPELKVLVFSGYSDGDNARNIIEAGADDFIHKPFHLEELIARINGIFEKERGKSCN